MGTYLVNSMKHILATKILTTIYTDLVQYYLMYGIIIWLQQLKQQGNQ